VTFQRARSSEQRETRRQAILDTAAAMLEELPVAELSLNELSRRVGLAKSNVLRYFETREAVLLELLDDYLGKWLAVVAEKLDEGVTPDAVQEARAEQVAAILSCSLADQKVLCDLVGAQGGVLERNVSVEVVKRYKRASLTKLGDMSKLVRQHLPEIGDGAQWFCFLTLLAAGALATYTPTPPSLLTAYADEPALGVLHLDMDDALRRAITSVLLGALPRT
jgi:AcrR family transcriptional regulator